MPTAHTSRHALTRRVACALHPDFRLALWLFLVTAVVRFGLLVAMNPAHALDYLAKWDGEQYVAIARFGYFSADGTGPSDPEIYQHRLAFFPAYPFAIRVLFSAVHWLPLPISYAGVGVFISCAAGVAATMAMLRLSGREPNGALLLLGAPMAITLTMVYTESLFLACALWALVFLIQRRLLPAAVLVALAGLVRLTAVDLWLVFAASVLVYHRRSFKAWALCLCSALPALAYLLWASWHTREVGGYFGMQEQGWDSGFDFGRATLTWLGTWHSNPGYIISSAIILAALVTLPVATWWARAGLLDWHLWLFGVAISANVLLSNGIMHSRPRLLLPAVVLLLPLARRLPSWAMVLWCLIGALISAYMVGVFQWAI
ncbi:hypothetical protein [Corynebacterium pseudopelargi]|uniref:Mannosyltransferase (PIG-V) n=1 Tax=Corynebacterium pseudopelargi TaxID=2080757 RepID=A0A3G6IXB7_9CORY|nr:hypothetical protein [Corynebacterium pseudopelargi]AZA10213.1 Mannosyltransferase (PIG-V) [Corynebacterium pseudopelargi]